jgi:hypothetical protein
VLTVDGALELERPYFWAAGQEGCFPVDGALGVAQDAVSPGAKEVLCVFGQTESFRRAAIDAERIGNVPASAERLRQVVEQTAAQVRQVRDDGQLSATWNAAGAVTAQPLERGGGAVRRVYQGTDGVLVPTVTQEEKTKRRQKQEARRRPAQNAGAAHPKPLPPARPGSDQRYKEMKIGVFYDQDKKHHHAFATEADSTAYGPLLKAYAGQIGLAQAQQVISLVDGAKWIAAQITLALLTLRTLLLDFYHLSEHVHATALCCFGDSPQAKAWAGARLTEMKQQGVEPVLAAIDALAKQMRSQPKRRSLARLRAYLSERLDMLHYPQALAQGWDIGSGPTEAMCKSLTLRLKRPGMKWDRDHAAALMNLCALDQSGQRQLYWDHVRKAA